ncbi:Uncharacterised protein [uncultured archaeon]|nr:Uncharacterised protein [uncultured archaeon]
MKKGLFILFGLIFGILLITNIYAAVYFSQPEPYYNYGDVISLNLTVDPIKDSPLKIKLVCDGNSVDVFNGPVIDNIVIPLTASWIKDLSGDCYFSSEYAGETRKTNSNFKISRRLETALSVESFFAKPGETVTISGTVKRLNGFGSNGEVELNIPFAGVIQTNAEINGSLNSSQNNITASIGDKFYSRVIDGDFSLDLVLPEKVAAGDYKVVVNSYETSDSGEKINEGSTSAYLKVSQVLTSIEAAINNQNFDPGTNISIKPTLLDQTGNSMTDQVSVVLVDFDQKRVFEKVVNSGDTLVYTFPTNSPSGYYIADISVGDMKIAKTFFVNEKAIVSFEIKNGTLVVKNIGNVPYNRDVQIELNGKPFVKRVNLGIGETKGFKLTGTDGNYDIKVSDGENELLQSGVPLTGNAVNVGDTPNNFYAVLYTPIFWILVILILLVIVLILARLVIRRRSVTYPHERPKGLQLKGMVVAKRHEAHVAPKKQEVKEVSAMTFSRGLVPPTIAEQSMVVGGARNRVAVIAIKVKDKITPLTKAELEKAIDSIYDKKGAVHEQGDFIVGIFSPLGTRLTNNEPVAAKAAEEILNKLREHNRKFKEKIQFGIGINSGEILNEVKDGKLKFTALGNTVILAKKLADYSNEKVIISKEAYDKASTAIKAEKVKSNDVDAYELKKVVDSEQSKKFINDFMKRNETSKKPSVNYSTSAYQPQNKAPSSVNNTDKKNNDGYINFP